MPFLKLRKLLVGSGTISDGRVATVLAGVI